MDIVELFNGVAVVIDDEVGEKKANINNIILEIQKRNMPCLTFTELPDINIAEHFDSISFLLLDWKLPKKELAETAIEGVKMPDGIGRAAIDENITFLKKLRECCFTPVFIFTNENEDIVVNILKDNGLYTDGKPNYIFVKNKRYLTGKGRLFKVIETWVKRTPSIYVLKAWEKEHKKAKNKLFHDFYGISPNWPLILWKSFSDDAVNMSFGLGEIISKNLYSRMSPFLFEEKILNKPVIRAPKDEVRKVLEGERFIKELHEDSIGTGDIFKIKGDLFLNIRPDCDCIPDRNKPDCKIDDVDLYLLKGTKLTHKKEREAYSKKYGIFKELDSQSVVFSIKDGRTYDFQFQSLFIKKWADIKGLRIGRLLPPYITRIQQRYSLYLQRQGLPRTPKIAVLG